MTWSRLKRLIGAAPSKPDSAEIVRLYGAVLESSPTDIYGNRSLAALPFDKAIIKAAIVDVAHTTGVSPEQLSALGVGFVSLATFQSGGGSKNPLEHIHPDEIASMSPDDFRELVDNLPELDGAGPASIGKAVVEESEGLLSEWERLTHQRASNNA